MLRRWLVALKEIERFYGTAVDQVAAERSAERAHTSIDSKDSPKRPIMVLYYDPDLSTEPMNFRDVFLHSQALEGVTLSMILEVPEEEEVSLLLEIFGICLTGGREVHAAIVKSIQSLAKVFLSYEDEVLAKREELLQCAQNAIAGLKVNAEMLRIDSEVSNIRQRLDEMTSRLALPGDEKLSGDGSPSATEGLKVAFKEIQLCSRLEALLLRKKILNNGDSSEIHAKKVDKLKVLSESLANSVWKAEKRISDNRFQRDEALKFRKTKTSETSELEKEMEVDIQALEREKDELEAKLKKVNASLTSARARLHNAREEREQFDEASNQIVQHFKMKEDELSRSIASYRAEADACNAFIEFMESTWGFQSAFTAEKKKQINDELKRYEDYFVNLAVQLLSSYNDELDQSIQSFEKLVDNLKGLETVPNNEKMDAFNTRKTLENKYLNAESKFITMFSIVESLKRQFYSHDGGIFRKDDQQVNELFDTLEKLKGEFDYIERPTLEVETTTAKAETPSKEGASRKGTSIVDTAISPSRSLSLTNGKTKLDPKAELAKLQLELELEDHSRDNSSEDLKDWEF
ncbi:hypothetical protein M9H77_03451 [Catharanthus roseus]|uniref:Uncharacterized protein n=1 Tax=Catharanthus roseus TaxID=4058 RepID=A0ACC0CB68_CATRO|nr:hypothetical protein M9H77_03451 [Catharanthus roseus]